jgi:hypothetical protein
MARKVRVSAILCGVALLLSPDLGTAQEIDAKSFRCLRQMTPVRQFYVDNLRGKLDATLSAANSRTGAVYPAGSVVQLIPGEAMVKRDKASTMQRMIGSSLSSVSRKMARKFANAGPSTPPIHLGLAWAVTPKPLSSGTSYAKPATVALHSASRAR